MWDNICWTIVQQDPTITMIEHPIYQCLIDKDEYTREFLPVLELFNGETMSDYMDLVAAATGLEKPDRASFAKLNQLATKGLISNMAMSFLQDSRRVKSERLVKELGLNLIYPNVQDFINKNRKQLSTIRQQMPSR